MMGDSEKSKSNGLSYRDAGVDIDAGNALVDDIKPLVKATRRPSADSELGGFGGLFDLKAAGFKDPILVAANDGVGTKLALAVEADRHQTIGIDLVAMCVNDLIVQGAEPLFFLDYYACGKLDRRVAASVIAGIADGCCQAGRARSAIRRANRAIERERFVSLGRQMLDWGFRAVDHSFDAELIDKAVGTLKRGSREDLMEALGEGDLGIDTVMKTIFPEFQKNRAMIKPLPESEGWFSLETNHAMRFRLPNGLDTGEHPGHLDRNMLNIGQLAGNLSVHFAPDGGAVPGDRIVGIITPGEGITVYPIHSQSLMRFDEEPDRWLDVQWDVDPASNERFPASLFVSMINEPGSLAKVANIIGETDGNIKMTKRADDFTEMAIDLEVWDLKHLMRIIHEVRALRMVSLVERISE